MTTADWDIIQTSNTARLGGTPTDWEDSFDENEGNIVSKGSVTGRYIKTAASERYDVHTHTISVTQFLPVNHLPRHARL